MRSRILVGTLTGNAERTVLVLAHNLHALQVDVQCDGLVGDLLEGVLNSLGLDAEAGIHVALDQIHAGDEGRLTVRSRDGHLLVIDVEEIAVQDGQ